jgi:hypothetical protein
MKILVIGYYNKGNLGDDAYQGIMGQFFPNHELTFVESGKIATINTDDYEAIIVGGGDIINDYFNQHISPVLKSFKGPKIAFSIGIPFPSLIKQEYLGYFDHVFTRNHEDIREIQKVLGSNRAHFIPDIALNYEARLKAFTSRSSSVRKCGIFLVGNLIRFPAIVEDIGHLVGKMALTHNVVLYSFNPDEDALISNTVKNLAVQRLKNTLKNTFESSRIQVDTSRYTAQQMIDLMQDLDFAICMRYHAHVFCTVAGVPFMSISSTRKTRSYMTQAGLKDYQYDILLNGYGTPISSNYDDMRNCCGKAIRDRSSIRQRLSDFLTQSRFLLMSRQASRLISINGKDIRDNVAEFIEETGDHQNAARLLSNHLIGYPDSPYLWGMYEKFKNAGDCLIETIHDSAQFLIQESISLKNDLMSFFRKSDTLPLFVDLRQYQSYNGAHRGGWYLACEELSKRNSLNDQDQPNGVICDMYIDRTFHWAKLYMKHLGLIPYTGPWCGFIHHTPDTTYSDYNTTALLEIPEFIQSLHTCKGLFTLSEPMTQYLRDRLSSIAPHVKVVTFAHPIDEPTTSFSHKRYMKNQDPKLINIGAWMRNPFTIYRLPDIELQKTVLIGKDMSEYIPPENFKIDYYDGFLLQLTDLDIKSHPRQPCRPLPSLIPKWVQFLIEWLKSQGIQISHYQNNTLYIREFDRVEELNALITSMINKVRKLDYQSNEEYDNLLSENLVFLDLIDAAAVNTIIECIVRQTPVIVNKIPGTVALLGEDYPFYYNNVTDVPQLLTPVQIKNASTYLKRLDKKRYQLKYFMKQMRDVTKE